MMEDFFENAPCGYFSFYDDGTLYVVNETLCGLLGYDKNELSGKNVETLFTLPTRIFYQTHFFPLVKMHGHAEEIFLSLLTKDNQYLPVLLNAKRVPGPATYTSCAFIVVPNRKKFEDELIAARRTAETALKENSYLVKAQTELQQYAEQLDTQIQIINRQNSELKQLNHVVTHSLKEPIRKILVYTEKMQSDGLHEKLQSNLERLSRASEQMKTIVVGLQQYVWINNTASEFTNVDLNLVIKKTVGRLSEEMGPDQLSVRSNDLPFIEADAEQMELLLYHILLNALRFKKAENAQVTITGTIIKQNTFRAIAEKYKYEDFLKLEIRDEGIGFDRAYRDTIFDLFKRLDYTKGQGLGLALCRKIVENHSGFIEADSRINEYTIITIFLPLTQNPRVDFPTENP